MLPAIDKDLLISDPNRGIPVKFAPNLREDGLMLKRAAREYYYPMMAIKHLRALSSGLMGKDNVFIPNIKDFKTNAFQRVAVFVPGIKATVERRQDGSLVVTELELSGGYDAIAKTARNRPGVYQVEVDGQSIEAGYKTNGRIKAENGRNVIIADTRYTSPSEAAKESIEYLKTTPSSHYVAKRKFDLFYSPVGSKLGSMRRYTPEIHTESYGFAGLLADAIEQAQKQEGVAWVSERSGSVVLTQALQTLALKKGVSFKEKDHRVCMCNPTTSPTPTLQAINKLKMIADKDLAKGGGHALASISSIRNNAARVCDQDDHYTLKDYYNDISGGTMAALGAMGAISFAASPVSPIFVGVGAVCSGAGALQLTYKTFGKYFKKG